MDNISTGKSLKTLRNELGISLRKLGRMSGLSAAYLVSVEKGASSPTIATMSKILKSLGTDLATFFSSGSFNDSPVFDSKSMRTIDDESREYIFLLPKRSDIRFEMLHETISANEPSPEFEIHEFDIAGTIISGGPGELEIEGSGKWRLKRGDSYYVKARQKHRVLNKGKNKLKQITVIFPPSY